VTPHAEIYNHLEQYVSYIPKLAEKVIFFNPAQSTDQYVGFNPLKKSSYFPVTSVHIDQIVDCGLAVWRDDPEIAKKVIQWFTNMLWCLVDGGLTLPDALNFLKNKDTRNQLIGMTDNQFIKSAWYDFEKLSHRDKEDAFSSLKRRIPRFSTSPSVNYTLGRTENVLDIEDVVENQKLLLCNFSGQENLISSEDAYLIGTLLINEIINYCKTQRPDSRIAKQKPFFLMIDEAHRFLSMKISEALAECAKNGLHLVLAHQNLAQLREYSEVLYQNVMTNAQTKIIFGGLPHKELEILEKDVFAGDHDFKKIKDEIYRTTVVDYMEETRIVTGGSRSSTDTVSTFESQGETIGKSAGSGNTEMSVEDNGVLSPIVFQTSQSENEVDSKAVSQSQGESHVTASTESESWSESIILTPILDKELASRQFYNLDELREMNIAQLKNTPQQHCFIKVRGKPVQLVKIKTIVEIMRDEKRIQQAHQISQFHQAQYYLSISQIKALEEKRQECMIDQSLLEEPRNFRE
jgi:hypothetical protein